MKNNISKKSLSAILVIIIFLSNCTKDSYLTSQNELLKKVKQGDYIVEEISYNQSNLVSEVKSTSFYRKFTYNEDLKLIKEEVAISPNALSSSIISGSTHEFVDPEKTGISMYQLNKYDNKFVCPSNETPITYKSKTGLDCYEICPPGKIRDESGICK
jgi:hypothetical protein